MEEVIKGQENDRLALAYSSKQKLLQAISIKDEGLKKMALLNLISSEEDARNSLMLSQSSNVDFINNTYLLNEELINRLDSLETKNRYWSKTLPSITNKIELLVSNTQIKELENK